MSRGGAREKNGRFYAHARFGKGRRFETRVPWATNIEQATARAEIIAAAAEQLSAIGRRDLVRGFGRQLAEATTPQRLSRVQKAIEVTLKGAFVGTSHDITFEQWADRYTSGELARLHPDHVKARNHDDDRSRLKEYILPIVREVPVVAFTLSHAQLVLAKLPKMSEANRRQVAQIMGRLMHLAVLPGQLIKASPLPRGWLPKITKRRHFSCVYPSEEQRFLAHREIPEVFRLFCGVLDREGMRLSMLLDCEWWQWGEAGTFMATRTKTGDPHLWAVRPDTAAAMRVWKERQERAGKGGQKPFAGVLALMKDRTKIAEYYRASLRAAGVTREELFTSTEFTGMLRAHDMRATFVTISLAEGKSETWIRDRTSHKSTAMIDRYRRLARQVTELALGSLVHLVQALGWWKGGGKGLAEEAPAAEPSDEKCTGGDSNPYVSSTAEPKFGRRTQDKPNSRENKLIGHVSRRREKVFHQSSTTPTATVRTLEDDADHIARAASVNGPGPARASARPDVRDQARKLASAQRGAAALEVEWDVLDAQAKAFDDSDGDS